MTIKRNRSTTAHRLARGFTLIELIVVLAIMALISIYMVNRAKVEAEDRLTTAAADNIKQLGQSLASYISNNIPLLSGPAFTDVTQAQLKAASACGTASCLSSTFQAPAWTGGYAMRVRKLGSSAPFQFEALVCSLNGWVVNTTTRGDLVGAAVHKVGGAGAMTYDTANGAYPSGTGTPLGIANYPASNRTAQLCYFVSQSTTALDLLYLRTDGTNMMNAALNMNGNNIAAANNITASGLANVGSVQAAGAVNAGGNIYSATGLGSGGFASVVGHTTTGSLSSVGDVSVGGNAGVSGSVWTSNVYASQNLVATEDVWISSLTSRNSAPNSTSVKSLLPKLVELYNYIVTYDGQPVPVPACPAGGTPQVFILPHVATGVAGGGMWGSEIRMAGPAGGVWTVVARDSHGLRIGINSSDIPAANFTAIVRTFCTF